MAWESIFMQHGSRGHSELVFRGKDKTIVVPLALDDAYAARETLNFHIYNLSGNSPGRSCGIILDSQARLRIIASPASDG